MMHDRNESIDALRALSAGNSEWQGAIALLDRMQARAIKVPSYAPDLDAWLKSGKTLHLRLAVVPFGDYWDSQTFTRDVDTLGEIFTLAFTPVEEVPAPEHEELGM
ncbi:hypothetical protein [Pseudosulfitobacter pseudonitzschiae]|uniref:hypothetical protein n=1 Tax=Pseudosulfitobacter pseudonitzschiae TaxID=1402135 RepID=UPI003B7C238A